MSAARFHARLRNDSAAVRNGNGREWKGMEVPSIQVVDVRGRKPMDGRSAAEFGGGR